MRQAFPFVALAATFLLAAPARAQVVGDNPATASRGGGDAWVFARAADGAIIERHWTGSAWTGWSSLGGNTTSGPAAVAYGSNIHVFARGTNNAIYQNTLVGDSWSGWRSLGGVATSAPAASVRRGPEGFIDLAVKGTDNAIYFQSWVPGRGWSGWTSLGGGLTSAPALNSHAAGIVNVFARGTDAALWQRSWNGSAWGDWTSHGGGIIGAPTVVSRTENIVDIYVRGGGNSTYQRFWTAAGGWSPWTLLDAAAIESSPAAGADGPNTTWLFARRSGELAYKEWRGGRWSGWTELGAIRVPTPEPPLPPPPAPAPAPAPPGDVGIETGLRCTPPGGKARVRVRVRRPAGRKRARVQKIVFFTKGRGRSIRVDRKAPFVVRIRVNRPAGKTGRVYARVYFRRSARGKLQRKTVSRRYRVCR